MLLCVPHSSESLEHVHLVRMFPLAKAHLGLVTTSERVREIAEEKARS